MTYLKRSVGFVVAGCVLAVACKAAEITHDTGDGDGGATNGDGDAGIGADAAFGPLDPGFMGTPAGVWQLSGGATLETWVPPGIDPGVARFKPGIGSDVATAFVTQSFETPAYSPTQQFALETYGIGAGVHARIDNMTLGNVVLGSVLSRSRICLGERAFGHVIGLAFGVGSGSADLDHVSMAPAPDCPPAGALLDGDFESGVGWTATERSEIVATGGPSTGRAGHLTVISGSEAILDHAPVSFPWKTMARPAMRVVAKGDGPPLELRAAPYVFGWIPTTATPGTTLVCVPEWAKGLALPFSIARRQDTVNPPVEYFVDDLAFVSEPGCPESSFVLGGDFEGPNATTHWNIAASELGLQPPPVPPPPPTASVVSTGDAHGGASHVLFSLPGSCERAYAMQTITVPPSQPDRGPAVKLWYKTSGSGQATITMFVNDTLQSADLPAAPSWTQHTLCLDPYGANRPTNLFVSAQVPYLGGACVAIPVETVAIDDVEVTTDPGCPAQ